MKEMAGVVLLYAMAFSLVAWPLMTAWRMHRIAIAVTDLAVVVDALVDILTDDGDDPSRDDIPVEPMPNNVVAIGKKVA
jgi:hypothetical protein